MPPGDGSTIRGWECHQGMGVPPGDGSAIGGHQGIGVLLVSGCNGM